MRGRRWLLLAALLPVLAAYPSWYGICVIRFRQDRAAADRALAAYDFAAARERLASCLRLWPSDPAARVLAAQAARRDGDLDAAEELLGAVPADARPVAGPAAGRSSAATPQGDARALEWALIQAQRGRVQEVQDFLFACLDVHHPASEQIREALACGCVQNYELDRAQFWVEELLAKAPRNPVGRLVRAQTSESFGRDDQALEGYRGLVADFPRYVPARLALAVLLLRTQNYAEAAAEYEELRRQQPGQVLHQLGLAQCWEGLGRIEDARPLLHRLQEQYPDNSAVLLACGQLALAEQRPEDAEPVLRRAAELAPNDRKAHYHLGLCLEQLGRKDEARRHLERSKQIESDLMRLEKAFVAMVRSPADPAPRVEAGEVCLRNGQAAEALRWFHGALDVAPNYKPAHAALADYFASQGDPEQAERHRRLAH